MLRKISKWEAKDIADKARWRADRLINDGKLTEKEARRQFREVLDALKRRIG